MKTIKVIDLLNKIANGEEVPKYIKYNGWGLTYDRQPCDYYCEEYGNLFEYLINEKRTIECLNDEVEIIEDKPKEDKKIEKMIKLNNISNPSDMIALCAMQWENNKIIENKINKIIDKVNEMSDKE